MIGVVGGSGKELVKLDRSVQCMRENDSRKKGHIADAQNRKRSERTIQRRGMAEVVGKQREQVAQKLPEHKQHDQVDARDHAQEDKCGKSNEREKPAIATILEHVIHRVAVDNGPDPRNQDHHDCAESVDVKP